MRDSLSDDKNALIPALLALEDGTVYRGFGFGSAGDMTGELVFNTAMSGYQEVLTDPSYRGQIVMMTAPEIGNVGVNPEDFESDRPYCAGFVVRDLSPRVSNWRAQGTLADLMEKSGVAGITARADPMLRSRRSARRGSEGRPSRGQRSM